MEKKVGMQVTVYTKRGGNVRGTVTEFNAQGQAYIDVKRHSHTSGYTNQPHSASGWYTLKLSGRGIWYAAE